MDIKGRIKLTIHQTFLGKRGSIQAPIYLTKMHCRVIKMASIVGVTFKPTKHLLKMKFIDENMLILNRSQSTNKRAVSHINKPSRIIYECIRSFMNPSPAVGCPYYLAT